MANIIVAGSLIPSTADTPLDARSRIANLSAVESIENPFTGMIFHVTATGKLYKVKTLKDKGVGAGTGKAVDTYEALPESGDLHTHENKTLLDKFTLADGKLYYDGKLILFASESGPVTLIGTNSHDLRWEQGKERSLALNITASDTSTVSYVLTQGSPPDGVTLEGGTLGGTPTTVGSSTFVITASAGGATMLIAITIEVVEEVVTLEGTKMYAVEYGTLKPLDITFDLVASNHSQVTYAPWNTLPEGVTLEGGRLSGVPEADTSSCRITATAGNASETIHITLYDLDHPGQYNTPANTEYLTLIAPDDPDLYAGESAAGHYWGDDDVLTLKLYNASNACVFDSSTTGCSVFNGSEIEVARNFHPLHAGHRVLLNMYNIPTGTLSVKWIRADNEYINGELVNSTEVIVKTESVTWDGKRHEKYFQRPAGSGKWHLKVGSSVTPSLGAKVYKMGAWEAWPSDGLGPEYAGHPVCLENAVTNATIACWQMNSVDGDPFWYLT